MQHFCFCSHFHEPNSKIKDFSCIKAHFFGEYLTSRQQEGPPALISSLFTPKMAQVGYATKEFLHRLSETVSGKLFSTLLVLIGVSSDSGWSYEILRPISSCCSVIRDDSLDM